MVGNGLTSFEQSVMRVLDGLGVGVLSRSQVFTGAVADLYEPESAEVMVFYTHCSDELLRPYAEAVRAGTTDALTRCRHGSSSAWDEWRRAN